jgi:hypothetical protein
MYLLQTAAATVPLLVRTGSSDLVYSILQTNEPSERLMDHNTRPALQPRLPVPLLRKAKRR